jgi:metal-responsive CopG/Arc/MetJ family transcriptional regulator
MKTAISIPDELFESADALAARLGVSRSHLYATAIAELLAKHAGAQVTARLDAVYAAEESRLDPRLARAQRRSVAEPPPSEDW